MKTLVLVRHAKSSWEYDVNDMDRPLKSRGITDANNVSNEFKDLTLKLDAIFSSPANRALSTCNIFLNCMNIPSEKVKISQDLYDFGGNRVVNFIKLLDDSLTTVMIFGHNHAFTSIVNAYGNQYIDNVPTCGLVILELDIENWSDLKQGRIVKTLFPKQLRD